MPRHERRAKLASLLIAWINDLATPVGGAERYVAGTASRLREEGVRSVLLYDARSAVSPEMTGAFDGAFPLIDPARQLAELRPDVVYAHQLVDESIPVALQATGLPVLRFFHDHKLFCLREGKYTTIGQKTCTRTVGLGCYPCLGFARRSASWPGVRLVGVEQLRTQQRASMGLSGFVVGSEYMASHVAAHGFDRARTHVIPLWVAEPTPAPDRAREVDLLLSVGQLIAGKGVDVLLEALARTRAPARLAVVGTGRQEAAWKELAAARGLGARVTFLGRLGPEELADWYRRAACVVMPTRAPETFGLVGVEAMSHATPVIASRVGGIPEWLEDGGTGLLVPPGEPEALASAIDRLLADPARREQMGARARQVHRARYLPAHHLKRLLELFRSFTEIARSA